MKTPPTSVCDNDKYTNNPVSAVRLIHKAYHNKVAIFLYVLS